MFIRLQMDHCCLIKGVCNWYEIIGLYYIIDFNRQNTTGSFRKNGKSKTVFMGTKFHEKLIFSAFFSRELATNLRSWATRSVTITLRHPENVALPVCFQALVGCLKPTTDPETLSKDHKGVFWSVRGRIGSTKEYQCVHTADFAPYKSKYNGGLAL